MPYASNQLSYHLKWYSTDSFKPLSPCAHNPPKEHEYCFKCGKLNQSLELDVAVSYYITDSDIANEAMGSALDFDGSTKGPLSSWDSCTLDIEEMSRNIPNVVFHLKGDGIDDIMESFDLFCLNGDSHLKPIQIIRGEMPSIYKDIIRLEHLRADRIFSSSK